VSPQAVFLQPMHATNNMPHERNNVVINLSKRTKNARKLTSRIQMNQLITATASSAEVVRNKTQTDQEICTTNRTDEHYTM
jgi:hypothetical protein